MTRALIFAVACFEVVAMIGSEENDSFFIQLQALERVQQAAKGLVQTFDLSILSGDVLIC